MVQSCARVNVLNLLNPYDMAISRFDPDTSPHINIICQKCGKIEDYKAESVKNYGLR
jgi:RNase P subunit RPR2